MQASTSLYFGTHHAQDTLVHIIALKHRPAIGVDNLALLCDHIVIIDNVFTDIEVIAFNFCLRLFDELRDHATFQRHILFHADHLHDFCHAVGGKTAHQFVVQGQEEARCTGVALTASTSTQLVIDTARFVPLGTDDMQTTQFDIPGRDLLSHSRTFCWKSSSFSS